MKKKVLGAVIVTAVCAGIGLAIKHIIDCTLCDCEDCDEAADFDEFEDEDADVEDDVESEDDSEESTE